MANIRDVGVIGFNNINLSNHMIPPLTTVDIPVAQMGSTAARRLLEMVQGKANHPCKILLPTKLVIRESLKEVTK